MRKYSGSIPLQRLALTASKSVATDASYNTKISNTIQADVLTNIRNSKGVDVVYDFFKHQALK